MNETFAAPVKGVVMPVTEVADQVFSSKAMGDGIAIDPAEGKIYAPFSGEITVAFPTGHAYGIKAANGKEVLIHIGVNTVNMQGEGFTAFVEEGAEVKAGQKLLGFDREAIKAAGYNDTVVMLLTNSDDLEGVECGIK